MSKPVYEMRQADPAIRGWVIYKDDVATYYYLHKERCEAFLEKLQKGKAK